MIPIKVERPARQSKWLRARHRECHNNRPKARNVQVKGCEECLLEIIWYRRRALVEEICRQHEENHPNLRRVEQYVRGYRFGACSRCIDAIFWIGWRSIKLAEVTDE